MGDITNVTMPQVKTTTFLIRKERLDLKATLIKMVGFLQKIQVGDKNQRLVPTRLPDNTHQNGAILYGCKTNIG